VRLLAAIWLLAAAAPAAHHSISSVYDSRKPVTITGTVREFQFVNPHPWIGLDVAGAVYVLRLDRASDGLHYEQVGPTPRLQRP
jgi:uncharacterized protein DUF6152